MQKLKFPMEYLRVTQGYGFKNDGSVDTASYSHAGTYAIDFGGKDTGSDKLYCPCDMAVKRCRQNANGELYLETVEPVLLADGTADYVHLLFLHDSAFNVTEGQVIPQGYYFYDEGGMGSGQANKFATHVHIEGGKGKWNSATQTPNAQGVYASENMYPLHKMFILGDDVQVLDDGGYEWKTVSDLEAPEGIFGVDVSSYQSANAVAQIASNGKAKFAILRACIGSSREDDNLRQYIKDIGELKIGFYPASYFCNTQDAIAEADYLVNTIEQYGLTPYNVDLPLFCDWEGYSYEWNKNQGREITPELLRNMTEAFCERIIERGYKAGVYLNKDYWDNWYGQAFFDAHPDYYIWYARPGYSQPDRDCYLWQYASDDGSEFGVSETIDKNILMGDFIKIEEEKWIYSDKYLEVTKGNCEFFGQTNVDKPLGKLQAGTLYEISRISEEEINGFKWAEIIFTAGDKAFVALIEDRCALVDQPNIYAEEIEQLKKEIDKLSAVADDYSEIISKKDVEINALNSSVSMKEIMIADQANQMEAMSKEYADIVSKQSIMISDLKEQIADKDQQISRLQNEVDGLKTKAENLEKQLDEPREEMAILAKAVQRFLNWLKGV